MALPAVPNRGLEFAEYPIEDGEEWPEGATLTVNADGNLEATADPPAAGTFAGFAAHAVPVEPVDIYGGRAKIFKITPDSTFWMTGDNAPAEADVGDVLGIDYDADGVALVDGAEAGVFQVENIDTLNNRYEVSVVASLRQFYRAPDLIV